LNKHGGTDVCATIGPHMTCFLNEMDQINRSARNAKRIRSKSCEIEQICDESIETSGFFTNDHAGPGRICGNAVCKRLCVAANCRQWGAQFMRYRQQEFSLPRLRRREFACQRINGLSYPYHFSRSINGQAHITIARAQPLRRCGDSPEWARDASSSDHAHDYGDN
jgi:hypothetical protein